MSDYLNSETGETYGLGTLEGVASALLAEQATTARLARTLDKRLHGAEDHARAIAATILDLGAQVDELHAVDESAATIDAGSAASHVPGSGTAWCWRTLTSRAADNLWALLGDWVAWLRSRYPLAGKVPACWAQHPELVEELTALHLAWRAAYTDPNAVPTAAADWHAHYLPGVLERIPGWGVHCTDTHKPRPPGVYADVHEESPGQPAGGTASEPSPRQFEHATAGHRVRATEPEAS
jgi:hypothetical protein